MQALFLMKISIHLSDRRDFDFLLFLGLKSVSRGNQDLCQDLFYFVYQLSLDSGLDQSRDGTVPSGLETGLVTQDLDMSARESETAICEKSVACVDKHNLVSNIF